MNSTTGDFSESLWPIAPTLSASAPAPPPPLLIEPGIYRFTVLVATTNAKAIEREYELVLSGRYYDEPEKMFTDGVTIKPL